MWKRIINEKCNYILNTFKNIFVKEEIVHNEQLTLALHCFQKLSAADASKCVCMWERVKKSGS